VTLHIPKSCRIRVAGTGAAELRLEGRRLGGEGAAAVVAPPHPLYGGTLDNPLVVGIAEGLRRAGCSSLSFNWRGVEGSEGKATDDLAAAVADYSASIGELASTAAGPYFATGYSFGAGTALLASRDDARIRGVVLVAPPLGMLREDDLLAYPGRVLVICGDDDELAPLHELQELLAKRPDITLEVVRGTDHFFHFGGLSDVPKHVAQHVGKWLSEDAAG
jgi:alpha/beta superfamily hydrolase